jgi:hypothetical protein
MRRAWQIFVFVAVAGCSAAAQFTTVTGTVTDPNGLAYAFGTISPTLVSSASPTLNGFAYTPPNQPTGLNSAGSFTLRLADNTQLSPGGSTWNFTVSCAAGCVPVAGGKGPVSFTVTGIIISGASQSITATLTAAALALSNIAGGVPTGVANGSIVVSNGIGQPAIFQTKSVYDARDWMACDGATNATAGMNTLLAAIGSTQVKLNLTGQCLLNTITIPGNVALDAGLGGGIKVATGQTVTIQGPIITPPQPMFFNITSGQGSMSFSGNRTMTSFSPVWFGIDCTGVTDAAPVWNQIVSFTGEDTTFVVPNNCSEKIGSTINVSSRAGFKLLSMDRAQNGGGNQRPVFQWTGSSGGMWNFIANQAATVEGFWFTNTTNLDYYLSFDQDPSTRINTEGMVRYNTFTSNTNNANFSAIRIGYISAQNGEKNVITDNDFFCSQTTAHREGAATPDGVLTLGSQTLTCASCSFTTDANVGDRIRVSYAPVPQVDGGIVDTTIQSITNDTTLTMTAAATSNQTGARIHLRGSLGNGILVGNVNAKHNTFDRDSFTQCACGINMRTGSFSATHIGGSANDVTVCINDISEPSEINYLEEESSLRSVETEAPLDSPLTLNHLRNSLSTQTLSNGNIYFGNGGRALIENSLIQLSLPTNAVLIGKSPTQFTLTSIANQWGFTMAGMGFSLWRSDVELSNVTNEVLTSCGDIGIPDAPGACFQFGEGGTALTEGHLVVGSARPNNTASYTTYTAETEPSNSSFVNEAVSYKSNFGASPANNNNPGFFLNLSTSMKMIGFDAAQPWQVRGGNATGFRFTLPTVQPGSTLMPFARGLWVAAPAANTFITEADGVYVEDLSTHTGITNKFAFKSLGASDTVSVAGPITTASQFTSTLATGTAPFSIASTTPVGTLTVSNHPTLQDCGTTSTCANTQKTAALIVRGSVAFPTAPTVTVTSLPFTGAANYSCTASDVTTATGVVNATAYTSGSSVTFTETNGVNTDTMRYICAGF